MSQRAERSDAVVRLFEQHYRPLCRLAYVIVGDAGLAEEIVMDALVRTYSGWGRLRDVDKADVYLRRAVVNLSRSKLRRRVLERRHSEGARPRPPVDAVAERHASHSAVVDAVRDLPERQRACVVLRYLEDLSEGEVAEILNCSVGTVKSQLSKARAKLQASLADEQEEHR